MVFAGYSGFLHYLQLASHELATIGINVTKNEIQIQNSLYRLVKLTVPSSKEGYYPDTVNHNVNEEFFLPEFS